MNEEIINLTAKTLHIHKDQVKAVLNLLSEGATVPFIARYRKEVTGALNEDQIRAIAKENKKMMKQLSGMMGGKGRRGFKMPFGF